VSRPFRAAMSPELRLLISPRDTYARLARVPVSIGPLGALRRPVVAAIVLGVSVAIAATRHVTPVLVLSATICWSLAIAIQAAIAIALIAGPARRTVGLPRAFDLFFASHAPWSLWFLAAAAWAPHPLGRPLTPVLVAALVPLVLTPRMLAAFFREVLEMDPRDARARTVVHQAVTWLAFIALAGWAIALAPRVVEWLG
jgi:hypothetical protein